MTSDDHCVLRALYNSRVYLYNIASSSLLSQRIPPILIQQHDFRPIRQHQTPLTRFKEPIPPLPLALEPRLPAALRPLHPELHIDPSMQLVQLTAYPRHLAGEVYLIAQQLARLRVRAQRVEDAVDGAGGGLLVVEDREA